MYTEYNEQIQAVFPLPAKLFTPAVTAILILLIVGILLSVFAPGFTIRVFAVGAQNVLHGRIWQLVSYPFVSNSPINLIFSGLVVLFVGSMIERQWRTISFILLWLVITVGCGLLWVVVNLLTGNNFVGMGASSCIYGLITTMGLLFRDRRFYVFSTAVKLRYLVLILIATGILMNMATPMNLIWIFGALIAYLYVKLCFKMVSKGGRVINPLEQKRGSGFVDVD
jgi:membrane associated rhomboid family serine protease